ncbi:DMT family transporter [Brevibacterium casei]|uniref:Ligand-binding protein SH3 n=1 Tax=Brevibacterium casei TaxID=33889 RepID=A0A269ZB50_9MICO|nr:multidrug efflux SMR transporter [Brevibacterium casei]MCT1549064.1 multidrug efflux SMR transporter [Brevibacterium casei]MCT1558869.1 multidrug efflux SMR transporter [Brevibacterium casei]MCT2181863.1 multidrug efflux SMR transporter [Brevibacterium casei]MCT2207274.1 multidrug efflux SMR transporter [Brevibacterium casei]PAK95004.1 ligand-binding protein SH3 [Brevibacterium casei]
MTTATTPENTTSTTEKKAGPWLALLLAGAFEVGYALSVNGSRGFTVLTWSLVAIVFFLLTLFFLSVALKKIDVGIGYAVWAGIGAVGAALLGPVFFDETLTLLKAFWLAVIIGGVVWLKLADSPQLEANNAATTAQTHE